MLPDEQLSFPEPWDHRRTPLWLRGLWVRLGRWALRQAYPERQVNLGIRVFAPELVARAFDNDLEPWSL